MLFYDTIDVSEGTDVNKTSASKACSVCLYWYFLNFSFKLQPNVFFFYNIIYTDINTKND